MHHLLLRLLLVVVLAAGCASGDSPPRPTVRDTAGASSATEPATEPTTPTPPSDLAPAATPTPIATPTAPPPPAACAPLVVLGARGSSQPPGLGAEIADLAEELRATVDVDVTTEAVDYPASPLLEAIGDPDQLIEGVAAGARAVQLQSAAIQSRCPDASLVWAGYSQGALVVRAAMTAIPDPAAAGVVAVVLLADPSREAGDPVNRGSADPLAVGQAAQGTPIHAAWRPITTSWCLAGDPFCDAAAEDQLRGLLLHSQGYRDLDVTGDAAREAAALVG